MNKEHVCNSFYSQRRLESCCSPSSFWTQKCLQSSWQAILHFSFCCLRFFSSLLYALYMLYMYLLLTSSEVNIRLSLNKSLCIQLQTDVQHYHDDSSCVLVKHSFPCICMCTSFFISCLLSLILSSLLNKKYSLSITILYRTQIFRFINTSKKEYTVSLLTSIHPYL